MRCTSTGLGKRQLQLNILSVERQGEEVQIKAKSWAPVIWDIRIMVEPADLPVIFRIVFTRAIISFVWAWVWNSFKQVAVKKNETLDLQVEEGGHGRV